MSALVVDNLDSGDGRTVMATMREDGAGRQSTGDTSRSKTELPARFKGKSPDELVEMYTNLESHSGRLANSLGQTQQQLTEALALAKRDSDLRGANGTREVNSHVEVNSIDLLTNPTKALEGILSSKIDEATKGLRTQISSLEGQLHQSRFNTNHSDAAAIFQDPAWNSFVGATPLRTTLAQRAQSGDYQAADTLLTEFKASRVVEKRNQTSDNGQRQARTVTLESGSSSGSDSGDGKPAGKIYRRSDVMALMMQNPDEYYSDGVQKILGIARREGRIVD